MKPRFDPTNDTAPRPQRATAESADDESMLVTEAQLLLSEKRTSLSTIRTGIAVAALPLSIVSVLVATSKLYDPLTIIPLLLPLLAACTALLGLGFYLMVRAMRQIHRCDRQLHALMVRNGRIAELLS